MKTQTVLLSIVFCINTPLFVSAQEINGVNIQPFVETFNSGEIPIGYTPPATNIEQHNPISSPPFNPNSNPFPNEFNDFNGSYGYGGGFVGGFSSSSSCGVRVSVSPSQQRGEWNTQLGVSWNSKKCIDEERIEQTKQANQQEIASIQSKTQIIQTAITSCLTSRQIAITNNQNPDVVCPLSFIYDMRK
jgi:hypothetical protein